MDDIEKQIQAKGLTAPRVTYADIKAAIASEHYFTAEDGARGSAMLTEHGADLRSAYGINIPLPLCLLTFCVLVLKNGFTVTGESACASPENFDAQLGREIAHRNAIDKLWPLMGYALKQRLYEQPKIGAGLPRVAQEGPRQS